MESYLMMLYVTFEQETALKSFFLEHGWSFCKPDLSVTTDKVGPASGPSVAVPSQLVAVVSTEDHSTLDSSREESDQTKTGKRKSKQGKGPAEKVAKLWVEAGSSLEDSTAGPTIIAVTSGSQAETLTTATMDKEEPTVAVKEETVYSDYDQGNDEAYENESTDTEDGYENTTGEVDGQEVEEGEVQLNLDSSMTVKPREVKEELVRGPEDARYTCTICHKVLETKADRKVHHILFHVSHSCRVCGLSCSSKALLKSHISEEHSETLPFMCLACDRFFTHKKNLLRHQRSCEVIRQSRQEPLPKCDQCGKLFKSRETLKFHVKYTHTPGLQHVCDLCGNCFTRPYSLTRHKQTKHPEHVAQSGFH